MRNGIFQASFVLWRYRLRWIPRDVDIAGQI